MAALAFDWLRLFRLLCNHRTKLTGSKAVTFRLFLCIRLRWTDLNQLIWRPRWLPWPLIGWDFFRLLCNRWTKFNESWQAARSQHSLIISLCLLGHSESKDVCTGLRLGWDICSTSPVQPLNRIQLNLTEEVLDILYQVCDFQADHYESKTYHSILSIRLPLERGVGVTKQTGTSNNFDKVWSGAPDGCVRKLLSLYSIHNVGTQVHECGILFSGNCSIFATNLQLTFWRRVSFGICFDNFFMSTWLFETNVT